VVDAVGGGLMANVLVLEGLTPWTLVVDDSATEGECELQPGRDKIPTMPKTTSHVECGRTLVMIQP